jgi:Ca2+:H+ antiporter
MRASTLIAKADWTRLAPVMALVVLAVTWSGKPPAVVLAVAGIFLVAAVLAAVHHAEVVAQRVGEPFGALILAVAVTVIEVGLIVMLMVSSDTDTDALARDTVFAAVMVTCNGIIGLSLLIGALKRHLAEFNAEGTAAALATVITLATICLVLPQFTTSAPGPEFTSGQLVFAAIASLALYLLFVFVQTIRHREDFVTGDELERDGERAGAPDRSEAVSSLVLLLLALVAVVGLAKVESPAIEDVVDAIGAPQSAVGVLIALLVLAPETLAAARNARRDRVQISFNLGLGSAMASIGLTIPTMAVASVWLEGPLVLGLDSLQIALLVITAIVSALTVLPGRATLLQGGVHLILFGTFLFFALSP